MINLLIAKPEKKVKKYRTKTDAIKAISNAINKNMTEKHLKRLLSDSNNR